MRKNRELWGNHPCQSCLGNRRTSLYHDLGVRSVSKPVRRLQSGDLSADWGVLAQTASWAALVLGDPGRFKPLDPCPILQAYWWVSMLVISLCFESRDPRILLELRGMMSEALSGGQLPSSIAVQSGGMHPHWSWFWKSNNFTPKACCRPGSSSLEAWIRTSSCAEFGLPGCCAAEPVSMSRWLGSRHENHVQS